jgi:transposase
VEHTFGWLDKYRRIILRYDAHVHSFRSFHYLASTHLLGNRLLRT